MPVSVSTALLRNCDCPRNFFLVFLNPKTSDKTSFRVISIFYFDSFYFSTILWSTEGTSKNARAFNCVQRSHQQILETLPGYFVTVLVSGLEYPVATFVFGSLWLYSRSVWVVGYADKSGDPALRYSHPHSRVFWHCKLALLMMSWFVAIQLLVGKKIFWDSLLN